MTNGCRMMRLFSALTFMIHPSIRTDLMGGVSVSMVLPITTFGICCDFIVMLIIYFCVFSAYFLAFRTCFLCSVFPVVLRDFDVFVENLT